jgi:DNA-binding GntR family transcriptional regulator
LPEVATPASDVPRNLVPPVQLRDGAAAHIRELIVSGQARPGSLLRLGPLADRIGASITPVREALILLAGDGWVMQEPNRGFRVAMIRRQDVVDAYMVYAFASGELASRAAAAYTEELDSRLRTIDRQINELGNADPNVAEDLNYQLHREIYAAADSPRLTWFVEAAARFVPKRYWGTIDGWSEMNRTGHATIINAIAAADAERAREVMSSHIRSAATLLLRHLDTGSFWDSTP